MHNWGAGKARLMSCLSARLQLLDLACHTHSDQPCKNYRLHWFLVFYLWVLGSVYACAKCGGVGAVSVCLSSLHAYTCVYAVTRGRLCRSRIYFECGRARRGESLSHIWSSKLLQVGLRQMSSGAEESTRSSPIITVRARSSALALAFNSAATPKMFSWGPVCVCVSQCMYVIPGCGVDWGFEGSSQCAKLLMLCLLTTLHISCDNKQISSGSLRGWQNPAHRRCGLILKVPLCMCHNVHRD